MLFILLISLLVGTNLFFPISMPLWVANSSAGLQLKCVDLFTTDLIHQNLSQSFICGTALQSTVEQSLFQQAGMLHLMIASGSHFQIFTFFVLLPLPKKFHATAFVRITIVMLLIFYCLLTSFQPAVVRALVSFLLRSLSAFFHWNWDSGKIHLVSGIFLLSLVPDWIYSLSFYLSWLASLGFVLAPLCFYYQKRRWNYQQVALNVFNGFIVQTLMAVSFLQFSVLSVFLNSLMAPVLALSLVPVSLLVALFPSCAKASDWCWDAILNFMRWVLWVPHPDSIAFPKMDFEHWLLLWIFLLIVQCGFESLRRYRYQEQYV